MTIIVNYCDGDSQIVKVCDWCKAETLRDTEEYSRFREMVLQTTTWKEWNGIPRYRPWLSFGLCDDCAEKFRDLLNRENVRFTEALWSGPHCE